MLRSVYLPASPTDEYGNYQPHELKVVFRPDKSRVKLQKSAFLVVRVPLFCGVFPSRRSRSFAVHFVHRRRVCR